MRRARADALAPAAMEEIVDRLESRTLDPLAAAEEVIKRMGL